jgi:hypothetical protein
MEEPNSRVQWVVEVEDAPDKVPRLRTAEQLYFFSGVGGFGSGAGRRGLSGAGVPKSSRAVWIRSAASHDELVQTQRRDRAA